MTLHKKCIIPPLKLTQPEVSHRDNDRQKLFVSTFFSESRIIMIYDAAGPSSFGVRAAPLTADALLNAPTL